MVRINLLYLLGLESVIINLVRKYKKITMVPDSLISNKEE